MVAKFIKPLCLSLLLAVLPITGGGRETLPGPLPARVIAVVDGDTIVVRARIWLGQDLETKVRLAGVDAPELHGACSRERRLAAEARAFVARHLRSGAVVLRDIRFGKYAGRVLARVATPAGDDLALALVEAGLARPYGGARRLPWCGEAERK